VSRRGAYHGKSGCKINSALDAERFKGHQALIMVHGQNGIELGKAAGSEKAVGREGSECEYAFFLRLRNGRNDLFDLLITSRPLSPAWGLSPSTAILGARS